MRTHQSLVMVTIPADQEPSVPKEATRCRVGVDVCIDHGDIEAYSLGEFTGIDHDLLTILAGVAFADRRIRRALRHQNTRHFVLDLPVYELQKWQEPNTELALKDVLSFATGDKWEFAFRKRSRPPHRAATQCRLIEKSAPPLVVPFSGGLDSYAAIKAFEAEKEPAIVVTALTHDRLLALLGNTSPRTGLDKGIRLRVRHHRMSHPEESYRTRSLLFFALASLVCRLVCGRAVVIAENGQGAVGGALISRGLEYPYQVLHPGFTARLRNLFSKLWGRPVEYLHPFLWMTKAEVVNLVERKAGPVDWSKTISCSRSGGSLRRKGGDLPAHCGICANCLLRRIALVSADSGADRRIVEEYLWANLDASSLRGGVLRRLKDRAEVLTQPNDWNIAKSAVLAQVHLARLGGDIRWAGPIDRCAFEISQGTGESYPDVWERVENLIQRHGRDWRNFLEKLGPNSWLRKLVEEGQSDVKT